MFTHKHIHVFILLHTVHSIAYTCTNMRHGLTKPVLSPILKHREMTVIKILCVITHQWLKLHLPNFYTFYTNSLPSRPSTVEESSCQVSHHFRWFFYSVFAVSGVFQHGWVVGPEAGRTVILNFWRGRFRGASGQVLGLTSLWYG